MLCPGHTADLDGAQLGVIVAHVSTQGRCLLAGISYSLSVSTSHNRQAAVIGKHTYCQDCLASTRFAPATICPAGVGSSSGPHLQGHDSGAVPHTERLQ